MSNSLSLDGLLFDWSGKPRDEASRREGVIDRLAKL
jgi:hypothetical protein